MNSKATTPEPSYELITPPETSPVLYREHGFPHPLVRWHYHREYELHLITHSHGKVFVGNYIGNFYPGNLILTGPNVPHNWITQTENDEVYPRRDKVITFTDDLIQSSKRTFPEVSELDTLLANSRFGIEFTNPRVIEQVHELISEIANASPLLKLSDFFKMMCLLAETSDFELLSSEKYIQLGDQTANARVNQAVNYIMQHYRRNITLEEVADHLCMKPNYFSKFFRKTTGRRFIEFVNSLRIARACDLIANSDMQITAICFDVGFSNIANFNRHFFACKEMTPSDYRRCVTDIKYAGSEPVF